MAGFFDLPLLPPLDLVLGSDESIYLFMALKCPEPWDLPFGLGSFTNGYLCIREAENNNLPATDGRRMVLGRCLETDAEKIGKYQGLIVGVFELQPKESEFSSRVDLVLPSRQFRGLLDSSLRGFCPNHVRLDFLSHEPVTLGGSTPFFVVIDAVFTTTLVSTNGKSYP